jgi:hypothetical protein
VLDPGRKDRRGAEQELKPLAGYAGIVQCDGYAAHKQLADPQRDGGPVTRKR